MIAEGDSQAVYIFQQYGEQVMPSFPALSDSEIDAILVYMESIVR
jgi:mono/diheme cytochrome c family protein